MFLAALLLACSDHRGELGQPCNPDGTCDSPRLECVNATEWLGIAVNEPTCRVKAR
jgi:hypothetical protein